MSLYVPTEDGFFGLLPYISEPFSDGTVTVDGAMRRATIPDVAAWLKDQWKCGTCEGDPHKIDRWTCPTCDGRGWTPPDEAIEAMIHLGSDDRFTWDQMPEVVKADMTVATFNRLVAFVEWMTTQNPLQVLDNPTPAN
jgi:hypothetical protein